MKRLFIAAGLAAFAMATPALAAAPKFTATCPTGITVKSNGSGTVRINGKKATVKTLNANAWEASSRGVTIDIAKDGSDLLLSYTAKGGANGICQLTSGGGSASAAPDAAGTPSKDEQACLAAASNAANNGDVTVLSKSESEANNMFIIGVGEQRAPWKCLVKNGKVAEISSQADEGAN